MPDIIYLRVHPALKERLQEEALRREMSDNHFCMALLREALPFAALLIDDDKEEECPNTRSRKT